MKQKDTKAGFRRVPGGYRRSDVNAFILSNDRNVASVYEEKDTEINEMCRKYDALVAERDALAAKLAENEDALAALRVENANQQSEIKLLRRKVEESDTACRRAQMDTADAKRCLSEAVPGEAPAVPVEKPAKATVKGTNKRTYTFEFPLFKKQNGRK